MDIFVSKDVNYNNNELAVMLALNYLQSVKQTFLYSSIGGIAYILTDRLVDSRGKDRTLCSNIKLGLDSLVKRGLVKIDKQDNNAFVIDTSESKIIVNDKKVNFITLDINELHTIFKLKQPFNILEFFVYLVGTINNKTKEWHLSQDQMIDSYGGSKSTINSYLEELERVNLIYVYRSNKRKADGKYHNINNSYGRYRDKDKVKAAAKRYINTIETEDIDCSLDRRSIKLRYNAFIGGSKKYLNNPDLVNELYHECILYNKSLEYMPIEDKDNDYNPKEKLDLTMFKEGNTDNMKHGSNNDDTDFYNQMGWLDNQEDEDLEDLF